MSAIVAIVSAVVLAACQTGPAGEAAGFVAGDDFSYMAEIEDDDGSSTFALIAGSVTSDGGITGEMQVVQVREGGVSKDTTELTGTTTEDGGAVFQGLAPDGGDVTATLADEGSVMLTDKKPGVAAKEWRRASLPAFNGAVQDATRG